MSPPLWQAVDWWSALGTGSHFKVRLCLPDAAEDRTVVAPRGWMLKHALRLVAPHQHLS